MKRPPAMSHQSWNVRCSSLLKRAIVPRFSFRSPANRRLEVDHAFPFHDVLHVETKPHEDLEDRAHHDHEQPRGDAVANRAELPQGLALFVYGLPVAGGNE